MSLPEYGLYLVTLLETFYEHPVGLHAHKTTQAHIVVEGSLRLRFPDGPSWDLHPGSGAVIPRGIVHEPGRVDDERRCLMLVLEVGGEPQTLLETWLRRDGAPWRWRCDTQGVEAAIARLAHLAEGPSRIHLAGLMHAMWGLFIPAADTGGDGQGPQDPPHPQPVAEPGIDKRVLFIEAIMRQDVARPYDARRLARSVQVSVSQMNRLFRANRNLSPRRRLQELRLEQAQRFLANSTLTVQQISDRCGFASHIHFTRIFREQVGRSPREFRNHRPPAQNR